MTRKNYASHHKLTRDNIPVQGNLVINGGFEDNITFFGWEKSPGVF